MTMQGIPPTLGGFQQFVTRTMNVPSSAITSAGDTIQWSYDFALDWVNEQLQSVPSLSGGYMMYTRAVYNLAADTLINWAQDDDPPAPPTYPNPLNPDGDPIGYWAYLRSQYGVLNFVAGVVQSTSDEGTSVSYQVPEQFKNLTIANLQNLKTPYGRAYLGIAGSWGPLWGLS